MQGEFIEVNGIRHWFRKSVKHQNDTPVVVLHGGPGGFVKVFEEVPGKRLEVYLSVIYYEQRGCGRSSESANDDYSIDSILSDLKELIREWGYNKVHLLGYSFGAELAIEFTLKHPDVVDKLVLQSPSDLSDFERIFEIQMDGFKQVLMGESLSELDKILESSVNIKEKYNQAWALMDCSSSDRFLFKNMDYAKWNREQWEICGLVNTGKMEDAVNGRYREQTVVQSSSAIENQTLILSGVYDKNVGVDLPKAYASKIEKVDLVIFNNSAHFPDIEETNKYIHEVVRFIKGESVIEENVCL